MGEGLGVYWAAKDPLGFGVGVGVPDDGGVPDPGVPGAVGAAPWGPGDAGAVDDDPTPAAGVAAVRPGPAVAPAGPGRLAICWVDPTYAGIGNNPKFNKGISLT